MTDDDVDVGLCFAAAPEVLDHFADEGHAVSYAYRARYLTAQTPADRK